MPRSKSRKQERQRFQCIGCGGRFRECAAVITCRREETGADIQRRACAQCTRLAAIDPDFTARVEAAILAGASSVRRVEQAFDRLGLTVPSSADEAMGTVEHLLQMVPQQ